MTPPAVGVVLGPHRNCEVDPLWSGCGLGSGMGVRAGPETAAATRKAFDGSLGLAHALGRHQDCVDDCTAVGCAKSGQGFELAGTADWVCGDSQSGLVGLVVANAPPDQGAGLLKEMVAYVC